MSEKYISASLFKEAVIPSINKTFQNEETMRLTLVRIIEKSLDVFPAADVEPVVRGKWIEHLHGGTDEYGYLHETTYYTCSNCGRVVTSTTTRCHMCFAHMERSGSGE